MRFSFRSSAVAAAVLSGFSLAACDSVIHRIDNVGGVDTLSIDAKQRMMLVGNRQSSHGATPTRVTCSEPSPDALVAKAAVLSANANVAMPTGEGSGSGGLAGGMSESAASIGFRNHTVQMLRDGYFRLCEAYLNGALSRGRYEEMVANADTFMAVVSALEVLGAQPVAPGVAISAGGISASAKDATASIDSKAPGILFSQVTGQKPDGANAKVVGEIVRSYLAYRANLNREVARREHLAQHEP
ncbi:hypothetical protein PMI42_05844 [Bradyrhizobium sp. YR681]|uniref:hypothetical protein n=1 Tax=Bradyrhizobium sp. YR681 TaxID=1144344 RepID=UPI00026F62EA|nr:hypothetical protein [Bradyrhizobium sp. YR681]EJN10829.1 hypothetical protein PMI42_05844 [Bradyrhizobium sp. YR681]